MLMWISTAIAYPCCTWILLCYCVPMLHMGLPLLLRTRVAYWICLAIAYPCCIGDCLCYCLSIDAAYGFVTRNVTPVPLTPCLSFMPRVSRCLLLFQGYWVYWYFQTRKKVAIFTKLRRLRKFVFLQYALQYISGSMLCLTMASMVFSFR